MRNLIASAALAVAILPGVANAGCIVDGAHSGIAAFHFRCGGSWYGFLNTAPNYAGSAALISGSFGVAPVELELYPTGSSPVSCNQDVCGEASVPGVVGIARGVSAP